jgi:predicted permease
MFRVLARLAPGASVEQARAETRALGDFMGRSNADTSEGMSATLLPVWKAHYGVQNALRAPLGILMAASGVVLLIVCANVGNLLLARTSDRRRELGVRAALGAEPGRLVRQLSTEVLLLVGVGALGGLVTTVWLSGTLRYLLPLSDGLALQSGSLDAGVLLFAAALALGVTGLAGLAPAAQAARENVGETLKEGGRSGSIGTRSSRLRALLVTSEMALAVVALIGAGLFLKSFYFAKGIHPGFDPAPVALTRFDLSAAGFDARQADAFCRRLREQLERQPGVTAVSYADYVPLSFGAGSWEDLEIEGYLPGRSENMKIYRNLVAPGYFDAMRIPLLEGRDFTLQDDGEHPPVMVVTREFVRRFVPTGSVLGRKVHGWGRWFTIVGVAEDTKVLRLTESASPYFYAPVRQIYRPEMGLAFFVRTSGPVGDALGAIRREAQALGGLAPMSDVTPLAEYISISLFAQRIAASLLSILAGIAFLLATIGLYAVMAYTVAQRTNEIGIRVTLGARRTDVLGLVARQGLGFALAGVAVGAGLALALGRLVNAFLVGVSSADPVVYVAVAAFTLALALAAVAVPARRALRVDPMVALRYE